MFRFAEELNDYFCSCGLLAGNRNTNGSFNNLGSNANFWSSLESGSNAWNRNLNSGNATVNRNANSQSNGFSARCLKEYTTVLFSLAVEDSIVVY